MPEDINNTAMDPSKKVSPEDKNISKKTNFFTNLLKQLGNLGFDLGSGSLFRKNGVTPPTNSKITTAMQIFDVLLDVVNIVVYPILYLKAKILKEEFEYSRMAKAKWVYSVIAVFLTIGALGFLLPEIVVIALITLSSALVLGGIANVLKGIYWDKKSFRELVPDLIMFAIGAIITATVAVVVAAFPFAPVIALVAASLGMVVALACFGKSMFKIYQRQAKLNELNGLIEESQADLQALNQERLDILAELIEVCGSEEALVQEQLDACDAEIANQALALEEFRGKASALEGRVQSKGMSHIASKVIGFVLAVTAFLGAVLALPVLSQASYIVALAITGVSIFSAGIQYICEKVKQRSIAAANLRREQAESNPPEDLPAIPSSPLANLGRAQEPVSIEALKPSREAEKQSFAPVFHKPVPEKCSPEPVLLDAPCTL